MAESSTCYVCPSCSSVNRVPDSRLSDSPVCGKCKSELLPDHPVELTDANFQVFIERTEVLTVVDFWASWCRPCLMMAPQFEAAAKILSPNYILAKLDTEAHSSSADPFQITGIPCLIAFRNGKEINRQSGAMDSDSIVRWVKEL